MTVRPPGRARRSVSLPTLAAATIAVLVVGGVVGHLIGSRSTSKVLDPDKVAAGVTGVLRDDYNLSAVANMSCPSDMTVRTDARYTCTFTVGTARASVAIVVQNDTGQYVVQAPTG